MHTCLCLDITRGRQSSAFQLKVTLDAHTDGYAFTPEMFFICSADCNSMRSRKRSSRDRQIRIGKQEEKNAETHRFAISTPISYFVILTLLGTGTEITQ